ncbi:hypothetical protein [Aeromicrobium endophyticum]|uniref:Lipoprotein n=1 Tax=Aeromicrobium endophyticum TaxID=2292704 RepID=A0A371PCF1_9ACTN|nr:hypothetical protein [Aeromicrobium endophyticum]REK73060.1 hypothetical protein DX116_05595 [Aeromicrobium endophyticum]
MLRRRPAAILTVVAMAALAGCGSSPDVRVVSDGSGYGFSDAVPGAFIRLSTLSVCVEDGANATVTGARFAGADVPRIDGFAVRDRAADDVGAYLGTDPEPLGDDTEITMPCPAKDRSTASDTGQSLVLLAQVSEIGSRLDLNSVDVDYRVDGETRTTTVPVDLALCPVDDGGSEAGCAADSDDGLD